ncbi:helix-turn-helix domain-containing protein [Asaia spathodeae]|uniref:Helix-turn-helix transcriptional regulator n=1 Tax=Asaia spathodeae TaxID=657016 RepID=A0ABX2P2Q7_9PROT|nr:helix-turn-helix transcriptional regulator [Asaia spathodeae]
MSNTTKSASAAGPIDALVGARIRLRRTLLGISQEKLGAALGLTFQQVQKYERGANKVGASRLYEMSRVLNVPIGFFFDDLAGVGTSNPGFSSQGAGFSEAPPDFNGKGSEMGRDASRFAGKSSDLDESSLELLRAFQRISDERVRRQLVNLVKSMASPE